MMINRYKIVLFSLFAIVLLACLPASVQGLDMQSAVVRDFDGMTNAWASKNYSLLWEYGTNVDKSVYTKDDFVQRMARARVVSTDKAQIIQINLRPPTLAYVKATVTFLDNILNKHPETRQFQLVYEDGCFRTHLSDFMR